MKVLISCEYIISLVDDNGVAVSEKRFLDEDEANNAYGVLSSFHTPVASPTSFRETKKADTAKTLLLKRGITNHRQFLESLGQSDFGVQREINGQRRNMLADNSEYGYNSSGWQVYFYLDMFDELVELLKD